MAARNKRNLIRFSVFPTGRGRDIYDNAAGLYSRRVPVKVRALQTEYKYITSCSLVPRYNQLLAKRLKNMNKIRWTLMKPLAGMFAL